MFKILSLFFFYYVVNEHIFKKITQATIQLDVKLQNFISFTHKTANIKLFSICFKKTAYPHPKLFEHSNLLHKVNSIGAIDKL